HQMGWWIYFVRLFHGLGTGILMASFFTLAADLIPISRRVEGIALFGISGHLSGTVGVLMGEAIVRTGGYSAMFLSGALLSLFSLFFSLSIGERRIDSSGRERADRFVLLLLRPTLRLPLIGTLVFGLSMTSYMVFLKPYVVSSGIGSITPFFTSYTLSAVIIRLIGGHWPDRWGMKPVLYPAMGSMAIGILVLFLSPTQMGLVLGGVLSGSGHGFLFPILSTMVIGRERMENRGRVMALFTMFYDAGLFVGAPILGLIAEGGGYGAMFSTAAAVLIVSMAGFIFFDREAGRLDDATATGR
ncbi:MAG: MFS transporter, partial [Candidatus Manganitrophaceae bacterium]